MKSRIRTSHAQDDPGSRSPVTRGVAGSIQGSVRDGSAPDAHDQSPDDQGDHCTSGFHTSKQCFSSKKASKGKAAMSARSAHSVCEYRLGEEIANSVSHGVGALLAIAALVLLIIMSVSHGGGIHLAAALIYGISMIVEYLMSTLYHALTHEGAKRVFKVLDHSCIYIFIAGSYTPFCFITLANHGGYYLAAFVWIVTCIGVALEAFWTFRPRWISAVIYVLLGWSVIAFLPALAAELDPVGLSLLVVGGICYTVGSVFYIFKKVPYLHFVFHLFVLAGSIFQFFVILLFVV